MKVKENIDEKIRSAFVDLVLTTNRHFDKISVKEICEKAGIGRSTFYIYYDSIYSLMQQIEDDFLDGLQAIEDKELCANYTHGIYKFSNVLFAKALQYANDNNKVCRMLYGPYGDQLFHLKVQKRIRDRVILAFPVQERSSISCKMCSEFASGGHFFLVRWWYDHPEEVSIEQLSAHLLHFFENIIDISKIDEKKE